MSYERAQNEMEERAYAQAQTVIEERARDEMLSAAPEFIEWLSENVKDGAIAIGLAYRKFCVGEDVDARIALWRTMEDYQGHRLDQADYDNTLHAIAAQLRDEELSGGMPHEEKL